MYKIYNMSIIGNETENVIVYGEEKAVDQYKNDVFMSGDGGMGGTFNTQLQFEKTVEELKKEFPHSKFIRVK